MSFYFIVWVIFAIISFGDLTNIKQSYKKFILLLAMIFSTILGGIRDGVGTDWNQYYYFFIEHVTYEQFFDGVYNYEYGYIWLNYLVHYFTNEYNLFLLIFTGLICIFKYKAIFKLTSLPLIVFLLNFSYYIGDIFSVRQSLAIAIILYSAIYIIKKDLWKFLLIVLIATFFHRTSIIFFPAYWIYHHNFSNKSLFTMLFIGLILGYSGIILNFTGSLLGIDSVFVDKLELYTDNIDTYENLGIIGLIMPLSKKILILIILNLFSKRLLNQNHIFKGFYQFFFISNIIYAIFIFSIPEIAIRVVVYYNIFEIFLLSMLIDIFRSIKYKILIWLSMIIYCGIYFYYSLNRFWDLYVPYKSIFF